MLSAQLAETDDPFDPFAGPGQRRAARAPRLPSLRAWRRGRAIRAAACPGLRSPLRGRESARGAFGIQAIRARFSWATRSACSENREQHDPARLDHARRSSGVILPRSTMPSSRASVLLIRKSCGRPILSFSLFFKRMPRTSRMATASANGLSGLDCQWGPRAHRLPSGRPGRSSG